MPGGWEPTTSGAGESAGEYCRRIEAHLCKRNDGHLVRIVGPVFQRVCGWHARGVPLKVALQGIDRTVDREQAKGPRRRPVRVEFCEADVLDAFDAWRRAVGVPLRGAAEAEEAEPGLRRPRATSLHTHIDRAMSRLTQVSLDGGVPAALQAAVASALADLDRLRDGGKGARGAAREALVSALRPIDAALVAAAAAALDDRARHEIARAAREELEPFSGRMPAAALAEATEAARVRLVRDRWRLPDLMAGL